MEGRGVRAHRNTQGRAAGETLVAATPKTAAKLVALGYDVVVEAGAGAAAKFPDEAYAAAGATHRLGAEVWAADVVAKVNEPTPDEVGPAGRGRDRHRPDDAGRSPELIEALQARRATGLNLLAIPRISRAQSMDVLSTMSNIAGYRGVIEAAESYGGMFAGQVTAAGKTQPATVFVIGAGRGRSGRDRRGGEPGRAGPRVRRPPRGGRADRVDGCDVRAGRRRQQQVSADGYAQKLTEDQEAATARMYAEESAKADIVITTALVRGWAPTTITAEMVADMKPGSVIVDLAAFGGGNCELTVPGEKIVTDNGVTIIGYTDLTSRMPAHTSQLYGTNIVNLLKLLTPGKDGQLILDMDDVVQRAITRHPRRRGAVAAATGAGVGRPEAAAGAAGPARARRGRTGRAGPPQAAAPVRLVRRRRGAGRRWRSRSRRPVSWGTSRCSCWRCSSGST